MLLTEELVRGRQADLRAEAARAALAREVRAAHPADRRRRPPGRVRAGLAEALHAAARRLAAGSGVP